MYRIREDELPLAEVEMGPEYVPGSTFTTAPGPILEAACSIVAQG
jgi:hypothetical protein